MPPDNGAFMVAGYAIAAVIIVAYAITLAVRIRKLMNSE